MTVNLMDAGPLVAYLAKDDQNHGWAVRLFSGISEPFLTCEPVLAEAAYLLLTRGGDINGLWSFLRRRTLKIAFDLEAEFESVAVLMQRYADVPMELADACLVRMSELRPDCRVLTTDGDFRIYRRSGRQVIPRLSPE